MGRVTLYDPTGVVAAAPGPARAGERLGTLADRFVGFIDAMKPNAGPFLRLIEERMRAEFTLRGTHTVRKHLTPNMAIAHALDPAAQGAVVAWGD